MKQKTRLSLALCTLLGLTHNIFSGPDPKDYQKNLQSQSHAKQPLALQNIPDADFWYAAPDLAHALPQIQQLQLDDQMAKPATPQALGHQLLVGTQIHDRDRIASALAHAIPAQHIQQSQEFKKQQDSQEALDAELLKVAQLGLAKDESVAYATNLAQDLLIDGASTTCQDEDGNTPLHYAIQLRLMQPDSPVCIRMIQLLMHMDADPHQQNRKGLTVMGILQNNIKYDVVYSDQYKHILNGIEAITRKKKQSLELILPYYIPATAAITSIIAYYS